ncbi:MAG TPA: ribose 5-phosphate isomerase B [Saprospiraceae bacterium]|nr:ribose 5-phosphate isomerase B [Saprospiraceae bacterium]
MADKHVISIGCDHAGFDTKVKIVGYLQSQGYPVIDHGTFSNESVDYPDFIHPVAEDIESGEAAFGIILCGSGNGSAMTANKHQDIRAALCWTEEIAALARQHNNANVISIPARFVSIDLAVKMTEIFLHTDFDGGRHVRRVHKISCTPVQ